MTKMTKTTGKIFKKFYNDDSFWGNYKSKNLRLNVNGREFGKVYEDDIYDLRDTDRVEFEGEVISESEEFLSLTSEFFTLWLENSETKAVELTEAERLIILKMVDFYARNTNEGITPLLESIESKVS